MEFNSFDVLWLWIFHLLWISIVQLVPHTTGHNLIMKCGMEYWKIWNSKNFNSMIFDYSSINEWLNFGQSTLLGVQLILTNHHDINFSIFFLFEYFEPSFSAHLKNLMFDYDTNEFRIWLQWTVGILKPTDESILKG